MATIDTGPPTQPIPATASNPAWLNVDSEPVDSGDEEYYDEEMTARPVRKPFGAVTRILCALAVAGAAFYGGVVVEKHHAPSSTSGSLAALAARFRAGGGTRTGVSGASATPGGTSTAGGFGSGAVVGTITLVDGSNVYVTDSSGNVIKVTTSPSSQITVTSTGTVGALHPGDNVLVNGPAGADGTVAASTLRDTGAQAAGGGARGGRGAGAGGGAGG